MYQFSYHTFKEKQIQIPHTYIYKLLLLDWKWSPRRYLRTQKGYFIPLEMLEEKILL